MERHTPLPLEHCVDDWIASKQLFTEQSLNKRIRVLEGRELPRCAMQPECIASGFRQIEVFAIQKCPWKQQRHEGPKGEANAQPLPLPPSGSVAASPLSLVHEW